MSFPNIHVILGTHGLSLWTHSDHVVVWGAAARKLASTTASRMKSWKRSVTKTYKKAKVCAT